MVLPTALSDLVASLFQSQITWRGAFFILLWSPTPSSPPGSFGSRTCWVLGSHGCTTGMICITAVQGFQQLRTRATGAGDRVAFPWSTFNHLTSSESVWPRLRRINGALRRNVAKKDMQTSLEWDSKNIHILNVTAGGRTKTAADTIGQVSDGILMVETEVKKCEYNEANSRGQMLLKSESEDRGGVNSEWWVYEYKLTNHATVKRRKTISLFFFKKRVCI